jgi:hypothetical protein
MATVPGGGDLRRARVATSGVLGGIAHLSSLTVSFTLIVALTAAITLGAGVLKPRDTGRSVDDGGREPATTGGLAATAGRPPPPPESVLRQRCQRPACSGDRIGELR